MEQLVVNKWIKLLLGAAVAALGFLATQHWTDYVSANTAGIIAMAIGLLQTVIAAIAPAPGDRVIPLRGTGIRGLIFTHKTDTSKTDMRTSR